jgi:Uma2 family endonuclease
MNAVAISLPPTLELTIDLTDEQFWQLCHNNPDLKFERTASGELQIMPPTGGETGRRNVKVATQLEIWNSQSNLGVTFDSSTCFKLPNGADRSPDASWIALSRWEALTAAQKEAFPPICPDFVVELRSRSDALTKLQAKMQEYIDNGVRLGWLIDPYNKQVEIYRPQQSVEVLNAPMTLSGEDVLPGFVLNLNLIM